jgi:transglutaminase-like putative cysteine protease
MISPQDQLAKRKIASLLFTQALVVIPVLLELPIWISGLWMAIAIWRWQILRDKWPAPGKMLVTSITLITALILYVQFSGKVGVDAALALLTCTFVLKTLEIRRLRDAQLLIFLGFFEVAVQLMLSQRMASGLYAFACCVFLIGSWRTLYLNRPKPLKQSLARAFGLFLQAIPVMLILFLLLPRIGPLWSLPNAQVQQTGFSDSLSLGELSSLVQNYEAAFRVSFADEKPDQNQLYWRGLLLNHFDGKQWTYQRGSGSAQAATSDGTSLEYEVIQEPHGYRWLFSLGHANKAESQTGHLGITKDGLIRNDEILVQRLQYKVSSWYQNASVAELTETDKQLNLQLPEDFNPATQQMVKEWLAEGLTPEQIIDKYFQKISRDFSYTLQPRALGKHAIDEFLFTTQQGFCEHFASSFVFVMRAAGIPARLVVGYQGGIWNDVEDYLLVSQADAHAWAEVWVDNRWQRFDPTAAIAPDRIQTGIDQALPQQDKNLLSRRWQQTPWLWAIQKRWDAASYAWQKFVLNYDNQDREGLLKTMLGGTDPWRIGLGLIALACLIAVSLSLHYWWQQRPVYNSATEKIIARLKNRLQDYGYQMHPGESLSAFCRRVASREPKLKDKLMQTAKEVERILYASPDADPEKLKELISHLD